MKRNFKLLVAVAVLVAMVLTLASCDVIQGVIDKLNPEQPQPHEHQFSADWSSDATNHWHAATCQDGEECTTATSDLAAHTFADGACSVCGAEDPNFVPECTEHAYSIEVTKEATCTEAGEKKFTCSQCGYSYTQEIAPLGHTEVTVEGTAPTCTEPGLSSGKKCSVCGTTTKEQQSINATGHTYVEGVCGCGAVDAEYNGPKTYTFDCTTDLTAFTTDKAALAAGSTFGNGYFTIEGSVVVRVGKSSGLAYAVDVDKDEKGAIVFTVAGEATVTIVASSTGSGNESLLGITDANGNYAIESIVVKDSTDQKVTLTYTLKAGTYKIVSPITEDDAYNRAVRIHGVSVVDTPVEGSDTPSLKGTGTMDDPFVLPELGSYTAAFPGGYDLVFYTYTVTANGYVTLSSDWTGTAWLKAGTDIYNLATNEGNGSVTIFALEGTAVYFGVADWDEKENEIPFTVSMEEVALGSVEPIVGSWKGEIQGWWAATTYIFNINADGTGTASADLGYTVVNYTISNVYVVGTTVMVYAADEYENVEVFTFTFDAEANTLTGGTAYESGTFTPYTGEEEEEKDPNVTYETVIVLGDNVLYFSAEEIAADSATRQLTLTEGGVFKFASGNLFVASIVDANGTVYSKNAEYNYELAAGEYTVTFSMLSMFGVSADKACELVVSVPTTGGEEGGDVDVEENPEFIIDETIEEFVGTTFTFDGYNAMIVKNYESAVYLVNIWNDNFDLYFTFEAVDIGEGAYSLMLTYFARPDFEVGKDEYLDTVIDYTVVIGGETEDDGEGDPMDALVGDYEFDGYYVSIYFSYLDDCYLANVYGMSFDLYFTFEAVDLGDGTYSLMLTYLPRPDYETGKDEYLETILDYSIVIGGDSEETEQGGEYEAIEGMHEIDGYNVLIYFSADYEVYVANIFGEGYDLYFTFLATMNDDGSYTIYLQHWDVDYANGTEEQIEAILAHEFVITPVSNDEDTEEDDENNQGGMVDTTLDGTYMFNPEEGVYFVVKLENGYIYVLQDTIGLGLSESFAYMYNPMMGMVMSEEGYFYVDVTTGDLYYGMGWLLTPVVE